MSVTRVRVLGLAFFALAEARAGMRTVDDAVAEARAQGERRVTEFVRQTIEREIARSMG